MHMTTKLGPSPLFRACARLLPLLLAIALSGPACVRQGAPSVKPTQITKSAHDADQHASAAVDSSAAPTAEGDAGASCDIAPRLGNADSQYAEDEEEGEDTMADGVLSDIADLDEALNAMDEAAGHHPKVEEADDDMSAIDARMRLVNVAMSKLGTRYRRGGVGETGFDCSGFTGWVYDNVGVDLPRSSQSQFLEGRTIRREQLQTGDLVFFKRNKKRRIHHVGIYLEDGKFIHSSSSDGVVISKLDAKPWCNQWAGAKRVF
ncbi:C40 family peptidase [Nitratidesulfovibrio sp. HK-II]|uniref:C40 family peptidase n=1 Tax=Nitratidesulfovibrio sp. HK-II TaxID=2009266 RepID=UPI000E2EDB5D|nr:C40 family peptidase [Nitratidesulfovibrio sp. HK-II]GBO95588.1 NLP/P60 family protein [Nitratidesulfovibrio sp. HK-II]